MQNSQERIEEYIKAIIKPIITTPDELIIETQVNEKNEILYNLKMKKCDVPIVVGKKYSHYTAIRELVLIMAVQERVKVKLRVPPKYDLKEMQNEKQT